jgi:TldD protein
MGDSELKDLALELVGAAGKRGVTFADVRPGRSTSETLRVQDGRADQVGGGGNVGAGVRVLVDGAWGLAAADSLDPKVAMASLDEAVALARASSEKVLDPGVVAEVEPVTDTETSEVVREPSSVRPADKVNRLLEWEREARARAGGEIVNAVTTLSSATGHGVLASTNGTLIERSRARLVASVSLTAERNGITQQSREYRAGWGGYEIFDAAAAEEIHLIAAGKVTELLGARKAPAGKFTVVFHPTITGLLVHEALGHNAEADAVYSGQSILKGLEGSEIASPLVTIVDDSTIPGHYGTYRYDSEGVPGRRRVIVDKGVLAGYMHSLETAARFGVSPTGSGRAQDHASPPIVRMSNTFLERGATSLDDLLRDIDRGVYLLDGHWGYVFVEKGMFTCHAGRGRMIERGELGEPLRDVSIAGVTLDTLKSIDCVANDFEMKMPGQCGKGGQGAPTDAGGPHVRARDVVVGGADAASE